MARAPNSTTYTIAKIFREYIADANSLTSEYSYRSASSKLERLGFILGDVSIFSSLISGNISQTRQTTGPQVSSSQLQ